MNDNKYNNLLISLIIPVHNEEDSIHAVLEHAIKEKVNNKLINEIIVVNNSSTDSSPTIIGKFKDIFCIDCVGNISETRNLGASYAKSELLAFVDGDCLIQKDWSLYILNVYKLFFESYENVITGSSVLIPNNPSWIEAAWFKPVSKQSKGTNHINSGNLIISKHLFEKLNGFDIECETSEDIDLCQRGKLLGGIIHEENNIKCVHLGFPDNLIDFYKREIWHGMGMISSSNILNNKALLLSIFNTVLLLLSLLLLSAKSFFLILVILYSINSIVGIYICKPVTLLHILRVSFLANVYTFARVYALWKSLLIKLVNIIRI